MIEQEEQEIENNKNSSWAGALGNILLSGMFVALGFLMLLIPDMKLIFFCYGIGCVFLICGICFIVRFFIKEEYRRLSSYGFSAGTLLVILGGCALIRSQQIAGYAQFFLGILVLLEGIIILQNALQLKYLQGKLWAVNLVMALLAVLGALLILLDVKPVLGRFPDFLYYLLIYAGIAGLISFLYVAFRIHQYELEQEQEAKREYERNLEESTEASEV